MKINPDDRSRHIFGWLIGGPVILLDILLRKLSGEFWDKAYSSADYKQWEFYIGFYHIIRHPQTVLDCYVDTVVLPKLNCWFILL